MRSASWRKKEMCFKFQFGMLCLLIIPIVVDGTKFYKGSQIEKKDDAFETIPLSINFPFFGQSYREIHVSTNGLNCFGTGNSSYTPHPFPINNTKCVASYWVDSNLDEGGNIFYGEIRRDDTLESISKDVRTIFSNRSSYTSLWAFMITFADVPRFGCRNSNSCNATVRHQTVFTTNGEESFVILLYDKLGYGGAQIGWDAGDGKRYLVLYKSNSNNSVAALNNSNVDQPGKWIFSVSGLLQIHPKKVLYFGGQNVSIFGPYFHGIGGTLNVFFGEMKTACSISNAPSKLLMMVTCVTPYIDVIGKVDIRLVYDGVSYKGSIIAYDVSEKAVETVGMKLSGEPVNKIVDLYWNSSATLSSSTRTILGGFQEDIVVDPAGRISKVNRVLIQKQIPNSGFYAYQPAEFEKSNISASGKNRIRRIYLSLDGHVFQVIRMEPQVNFSCTDWYNSQPDQEETNRLKNLALKLNPCPPSIPSVGGFEMDENCFPSGREWCEHFRPKAKGCYRSIYNRLNVVTQCCYDERDDLLLGPCGGGTFFANNSKNSKSEHFVKEILPYFYCCILETKCDLYHEKRPSIY